MDAIGLDTLRWLVVLRRVLRREVCGGICPLDIRGRPKLARIILHRDQLTLRCDAMPTYLCVSFRSSVLSRFDLE